MTDKIKSKLVELELRQALYQILPTRRDAIFNMLDALSADGHHCKSVTSLSESCYFPRQYSSLTDAIVALSNHSLWEDIKKTIWPVIKDKTHSKLRYYRFVVDATPNPRPFSHCLADRTIIHTPNPTPGNKPIGVGHQYSVLACLPPGNSKERKTWLAPVDAQRVLPTQKSHDLGMEQLTHYIKHTGLEKELCLSVADSAYGTETCRKLASLCDELVHIFRMRSNRVVYKCADHDPEKKRGRVKKYGNKFGLNCTTHTIEPDRCLSFPFVTKKGRILTVNAQCYEDMIFKGSKNYTASDHPFRLMKYTVCDKTGVTVFAKPLWIAITGKQRKNITIEEGFTHYMDRYDIEHFFKFAKRNLLMNQFQSPDCMHEEAWWNLVLLAYIQLYVAKEAVVSTPKPWERYLPEYKNHHDSFFSPSQTQRGFNTLLNVIGSPAKLPKQRGKPRGRAIGGTQSKRAKQPVIFKTKPTKKLLTQGLKKTAKNSNPKQKKNDVIETIISLIKKAKLSHKEISEQILMAA
jgi:hypothetical protein